MKRCFPLLVTALFALPAHAADPRDDLLRLVPDDVAFCLVVQDLRDHSRALLDSPFAEQFLASSAGKALRSAPELKKLAEVEKHLQRELDLTWVRLRDDLLGDAVVMAYRATPGGKTEEQGLFLLHARDPELLARVVDRLNEAQKKSGELKDLQAHRHKDVPYFRRSERNGEEHFYFVRGPILAFASNEAMLRQAIERDLAATNAEPAITGQLRRLGTLDALAVVWVNPRAFDAEVQKKAAEAKGDEAFTLQRIDAHWRALDGLALALALQPQGLKLDFAVLAREKDLPPSARGLFAGMPKPSELWKRFPEHALLTMAGQVDAVAFNDFLADFLPAEQRRQVRADLERSVAAFGFDLNDLLPNLGPDWGLCVYLPPDGAKALLPAAVAALRVQAGEGKEIDQRLLKVVNSFVSIGLWAHNKSNPRPLALKTAQQGKVEVQYLHGESLPAGLQPAFALKDGYLVFASSPDAILRFADGAGKPPDSGDYPLVRLSVRAAREYFKLHKDALIAQVAAKHQIGVDEAAQRLQALHAVAPLFDRLELVQSSAPGRLTLSLRVQASQRLRK